MLVPPVIGLSQKSCSNIRNHLTPCSLSIFFFKRLVNKFWQQFWDILKMKFGQSFWIREGVQLFALLFSLCDFSVVYVLSLADNQDLKVRISFCYFQPWPPNAYYENGFFALRFYNPY